MGKIRCPECRYRAAKFSDYTCDYAGITGHTRRAVPPERCRHFEPEQPPEAAKRVKPKGPAIAINPSRRRTRYDWEKAKMLYDQKWSDSKIAAAVFSSRFVTLLAMAKIWSAACRVSAATRSQ